MKALIRKHGFTTTKKEQDEVFLEPSWPDWIQADGRPLTDENLGYALCDNLPNDLVLADDRELTPDDFEVTEHTKTVPSEYGDGEELTVKYWKATYIGKPDDGVQPNTQMKTV